MLPPTALQYKAFFREPWRTAGPPASTPLRLPSVRPDRHRRLVFLDVIALSRLGRGTWKAHVRLRGKSTDRGKPSAPYSKFLDHQLNPNPNTEPNRHLFEDRFTKRQGSDHLKTASNVEILLPCLAGNPHVVGVSQKLAQN